MGFVLVRLQQLHVGRDDLAAHVVEHLGRREEVVVHGGGDRRQEADRGGHEQVLGRCRLRVRVKAGPRVRVRVRARARGEGCGVRGAG